LGGIEDLERSIEIAKSINSPESVRACGNLATVLAQRGDLRRSWELEAECRRLADRFGSLQDVRWTRAEYVSELYSLGRWDEALRAIVSGDFERAAAVCAEIGVAPDEAGARLRAAEALTAAGRRIEAGVQLERALAFYRSVDAERYISEAEVLLAATA